MLVPRPEAESRLREALAIHPCAALLGPRQCGKTTLARHLASGEERASQFDLERRADRIRLSTPELTLAELEGLVVIDEVQRAPELMETIRVLVDRPGSRTRFLLLGSASPSLVRGASESLAGRIGLVDLGGFSLADVGAGEWRRLFERGGFPRSFLARSDRNSALWRRGFVRTFLESDLPQLGVRVPAETLRRFWTMVAHYHGQRWNNAEFARALGSSEATARRYLDIMSGAYVVRALPPWFENMRKRQVKSPKVYLRDTGILHSLLGVDGPGAVTGHPKVGASFEGFVIEQLLQLLDTRDAYHWAVHAGAEIDLLVLWRGRRFGFECKWSVAPKATRSMRTAVSVLGLDHLWVVHPGTVRYGLSERITALPVGEIAGVRKLLHSISARR